MADELQLLAAENKFFGALRAGDPQALESILADDFIIIDVLSGSETARAGLISAVESDELRFDVVNALATRVRFYGTTAVVTGSTVMSGAFGGAAFGLSSRYTHVYAEQDGHWKLVSAQGTPIKGK